jgi:hypothetical protein
LSESTGGTSISLTGSSTTRGWFCWATSSTYSVGSGDSGTWVFHLVWTSNTYAAGSTITVRIHLGTSRTTLGTQQGTATYVPSGSSGTADVSISVTVTVSGNRYVQFSYKSNAGTSTSLTMNTSTSTGSYLIVPESALILLVIVPFLPKLILKSKKNRRNS